VKRPPNKVPALNDGLIAHIERLVARVYSPSAKIEELIPASTLERMRAIAMETVREVSR